MRVLITGAAGNLGRKAAAGLRAAGHELVLIDRRSDVGDDILVGDLCDWDGGWRTHMVGIEGVVHLAATPDPWAGWDEVQTLNLDMTFNVFEAAAQAGVRRLVFASSNWVVAGHRGDDALLTSSIEPAPTNAYGASKLVGERLGRFYGEVRGMSVISLRIGHCQRAAGNQPGPHVNLGLWGQRMWLSDRDFQNGIALALAAPETLRHATLNLVSDNTAMRWDLEEAAAAIGYRPLDRSDPDETDAMLAREDDVRRLRGAAAQIEALITERRW